MSAETGTDIHCQSLTMAGQPCRSVAVMECGHCNSHCPQFEAERQEARRRGGKNSSAVERAYSRLPDDLRAISRLLADTITEVKAGTLAPAVGNSIASLSRALIGAIESGNVETRVGELEDLLTRLDERLELRVAS